MDVNSYIHTLCKKGEGTEIEFKSAKGGFPEVFGRRIPHSPIRMEE